MSTSGTTNDAATLRLQADLDRLLHESEAEGLIAGASIQCGSVSI